VSINQTKEIMGQLTNSELKKLTKALDILEYEVYVPFKNINGGFAEAIMFDYDDEIIDIELLSGVQDGEENRTYSEQLKIDRKTMKVID